MRDFGDGRVGGGGTVGDKVRVGGGVPTKGEGCAVAKVAGVGLEEGLWAGAGDEAAGPKVGVQESSVHEVSSAPLKVGGGKGARQ